jgi:TonB family protein
MGHWTKTIGMIVLLVFQLLSTAQAEKYSCSPRQNYVEKEPEPPEILPERLAFETPKYPGNLQKLYAYGKVELLFTVTKAGTVRDVQVLESQHPALESSSVAAFLKAKFKPAQKAGKPVESCVSQTIHFELEQLPVTMPPQQKENADRIQFPHKALARRSSAKTRLTMIRLQSDWQRGPYIRLIY